MTDFSFVKPQKWSVYPLYKFHFGPKRRWPNGVGLDFSCLFPLRRYALSSGTEPSPWMERKRWCPVVFVLKFPISRASQPVPSLITMPAQFGLANIPAASHPVGQRNGGTSAEQCYPSGLALCGLLVIPAGRGVRRGFRHRSDVPHNAALVGSKTARSRLSVTFKENELVVANMKLHNIIPNFRT